VEDFPAATWSGPTAWRKSQACAGTYFNACIDTGSETMYLVLRAGKWWCFLLPSACHRYHHRPATSGSPVTIHASVPGTNAEAVNGVITLNNSCLQRAALLLSRGTLYIGFFRMSNGLAALV